MIENIQMKEADRLISTFIFLLILFVFLSTFILKRQQSKHRNLPPIPPAFPLIGHLHLIKESLHRILHNLTEKYGHILFLHLGKCNVLVISSPSTVEECFTKNDIIFANRPHTLAAKHLNYNSNTLKFASYGDHWRNLRRLTALELFSTNCLAFFARIREEDVHRLVKQLFIESKGQVSKIELRSILMEISFNIMLRMISGKRYYGKDAVTQEGKEFQILMKEFIELEGSGNLNDFFPILQWIDFQGLEKRMVKLKSKMDNFFQNLIDEQRRNRSMINTRNDQRNMTLIDVMLDKQNSEPELYTHETIKGVILTMLVAGTATASTTMEWALSLLLNHPEAMSKTKVEINPYVGQNQLLKEADTTKLKYLQNVITETLRLYPVAPFLVPHESSDDCKVCGFDIPRGIMLLVNLWTLHRDPKWWVDPTRFVPERFDEGDGSEIYNMIPFGIGRRACPGGGLAKRVMGLVLGALIQCFEWDKIGDGEINMTEGTGVTIPKAEPLVALCKPRQGMIQVLSNI